MKTKNRRWNSLSGDKKGFIFTYDVLIAFVVLLIIIVTTTFFTSKATEDKLANVHTSAIGSDVVNILIKTDVLSSFNETVISSKINKIIPVGYDVTLDVVSNTGEVVSLNRELPAGGFIGSGKMYFITADENIARVEYKVWQKE